jgi:hypothetical protein
MIAVFLHSKLPDSIAMCIIFNYDVVGLLVHQPLWLYAPGKLIDTVHQQMLVYSQQSFAYLLVFSSTEKR